MIVSTTSSRTCFAFFVTDSVTFLLDEISRVECRWATNSSRSSWKIVTFHSIRRWILGVLLPACNDWSNVETRSTESEESEETTDADLLLFLSSQHVWSWPLPFALTSSSLAVTHFSLPAAIIKSAVFCETWIMFGWPVLSIRAAVLTVSPNSWKRAFSPLNTPMF